MLAGLPRQHVHKAQVDVTLHAAYWLTIVREFLPHCYPSRLVRTNLPTIKKSIPSIKNMSTEELQAAGPRCKELNQSEGGRSTRGLFDESDIINYDRCRGPTVGTGVQLTPLGCPCIQRLVAARRKSCQQHGREKRNGSVSSTVGRKSFVPNENT